MNLHFESLQEFELFAVAMGYTKGTPTKTAPVTQADIQKNLKAETKNDPADTITAEDVTKIGGDLVTAGKRDKLIAILGEFGAKKVGNLKPEQLQPCYDKLKAAL